MFADGQAQQSKFLCSSQRLHLELKVSDIKAAVPAADAAFLYHFAIGAEEGLGKRCPPPAFAA